MKIDILITDGGVTSFEALSNNIECIYIPINHYQKACCNFMKKNKTTYILSYDKVFNKNGKQILINCLKNISKKENLAKKKYIQMGEVLEELRIILQAQNLIITLKLTKIT